MPLLTAADLKQAVADSMQLPNVNTLPTRWDRVCQMAVDEGAKDIFTILISRGYTGDQVSAWDRLTSFHRLQSLYYAFLHGIGMHSFDDRWVNKLDQRDTLRDPLTVIGEAGGVTQAAGEPGFAKFGRFDSTNDKWTRDTLL